MKQILIYILHFLLLTSVVNQRGYSQTTSKNITLNSKKLADSLYSIGSNYDSKGYSEKALVFYNNSLKIYNSIGEYQKVGECYDDIGRIYYFKGYYTKALDFFEQSLNAHKKANNKKGVAGILNGIGAVHFSLGAYLKAVDSYKKAIILQEELGNKKIVAVITLNIGGIFSIIKDYANAIKYINQSHLIFKELKYNHGIAKALLEIGYIDMQQGNYTKALKNFNQSLPLAIQEKDKQLEIEILSNLGELFYKKTDFQKSLYYHNLCLKHAEDVDNLQYKSLTRIAIGKIFIQSKKYKEAVEKCKLGLVFADEMKATPIKKEACECLYKSYKSLGQKGLALDYYEKVNIYNDSLKSEETSNRMMNMEFQKQQLVDSIAYVKKENLLQLKHKEEVQKKEKQRNIIIVSLGFIFLIAVGLWGRLNLVRKSKAALQIEKDRSEALLLNILPEEIAEELKEKGSVNAREFNLVSILFSDFKSFTQTAEKMTPQTLVEEINVCFKAFDLIAEKYQVEKIKTIGDAYMAAGGIPVPSEDSLKNIVLAGLEMQAFMIERAKENEKSNLPFFEMRLGIHAGPIVAGIVGVKKFQYDVWGDTVNTASRIESNGMVGKVNISETLYQLIKHEPCFKFEYRGNINAKGKGEIAMYFVEKAEIV
ncbi:MAG: adenylate/guanylate cyclase domain-containing protein [Spirosomataceae bacterium]